MRNLFFAVVGTIVLFANAAPAAACGGFFCGQQPVDQQAERIIFAMDEQSDTTEMIVQIGYQGSAADFAWVVPLGAVPLADSLGTFPQAAMTALDANTAPQVFPTSDCRLETAFAAGGPPIQVDAGSVTVHLEEEVGPFAVAVVESEDPAALVQWLRDNRFRVTAPMEPYIALYTEAGLKFLALRLRPEAKVSQIEPFRMTLPGTSPAVPLRMTALAAEPEMGVIVFLLGAERYTSANWPELDVDPDDLVVDPFTFQHNWTAEVARVIDEAGGQGFVADMAGPTEDMVSLLERTMPTDPEQAEAQQALLDLVRPHPYLTRLYARLSAEEMSSDPTFRRSTRGDVPRLKQGAEWTCEDMTDLITSWPPPAEVIEALAPRCAFATGGAGGSCATVAGEGDSLRTGCACVPGATARTTLAPHGTATVICQDRRMSFLNPGDRETPDSAPLPDPCVGFDCGAGTCVPMNMTPTCVCDEGFVAIGAIDEDGVRSTSCVAPMAEVPAEVYRRRLPDLPADMPAGVDVDVPPPAPVVGSLSGSGWCGVSPARTPHAPLIVLLGLVGLLCRRRVRG